MPLLVDGMNVIGSRPDGWWRDRDGAVRRLVEQLGALGEPVTVVFDGRPVAGIDPNEDVRVVFANRGGPDAADDRIVELLAADDDPTRWLLVTSDRMLRDRARARGAAVEGVTALLERLG